MLKHRRVLLPFLVLTLVLLSLPAASLASDWEWTITPYVWLPNIVIDTTLNAGDDIELVDSHLSNLIDDTDFMAMGRFEGRNGKHGFFLDLKIGDFGDEPRFFDLPGGNITLEAKSDLEITTIEAGGLFNLSGDGNGFSLFYGLRVIDIDQEIDLHLPPALGGNRRIVNASGTGVDGLLAFRYDQRFENGWAFSIGGDGAAGDSEFTWGAEVNFGYYFGERDQFGLIVGYRYKDLQLEEADERVEVETEIELRGVQAGFTFSF